jgi:hypothetical protein
MPNDNEELVDETYRFSQTKILNLYSVAQPDPTKTYKEFVDTIMAIEECLQTFYNHAKK